MSRRTPLVVLLTVSGLVALAACGDDGNGSGTGGTDAGSGPPDSEIAATAKASNDGEISTSQLAASRSSSADVKAYATDMITMHGQLNAQADQLLAQQGITAAPGPTTAQVTASATQLAGQLAPLTDSTFDRAYMDGQIQLHTSTRDLLQNTLIPSARNAALKSALQTQVLPMVLQHLQRAQSIRAAL